MTPLFFSSLCAALRTKQEYIPVGCVLPALYHGAGGLCPVSDRDPWTETSPDRDPVSIDKHLWKHNLRKLCLGAVITDNTDKDITLNETFSLRLHIADTSVD